MIDIDALLRPEIRHLTPYSSARHEYSGDASVWLDANENPYDTGLNRYPDPGQSELKEAIGQIKAVGTDHIFLGNGSDEAIDLLIRAFCRPGKDSILVMSPTYGMYKVCADINGVEVVDVPLDTRFDIDMDAVSTAIEEHPIKLIFCCSPNNPTGNLLSQDKILQLANAFNGLVVVDEAYADFVSDAAGDNRPAVSLLSTHDNLVVLQTFSKAWGMAGIRLGMAFAAKAVVDVLNRIKPPYNVNTLTQQAALKALVNRQKATDLISEIVAERGRVEKALAKLPCVIETYPSEANFLLVKFADHRAAFHKLMNNGVVVRDRSSHVEGCLRITVGTPPQNDMVIKNLSEI